MEMSPFSWILFTSENKLEFDPIYGAYRSLEIDEFQEIENYPKILPIPVN